MTCLWYQQQISLPLGSFIHSFTICRQNVLVSFSMDKKDRHLIFCQRVDGAHGGNRNTEMKLGILVHNRADSCWNVTVSPDFLQNIFDIGKPQSATAKETFCTSFNEAIVVAAPRDSPCKPISAFLPSFPEKMYYSAKSFPSLTL